MPTPVAAGTKSSDSIHTESGREDSASDGSLDIPGSLNEVTYNFSAYYNTFIWRNAVVYFE